MRTSKEEFKKLQTEWYARLKSLGFKDIETRIGDELLLNQSSFHAFKDTDSLTAQIKEEYFTLLQELVSDENTYFTNEADRYIMARHSEGAKIQSIISELFAKGITRRRNSIRFIIRRYEMKWKIKFYTRKQLNLYKLKRPTKS